MGLDEIIITNDNELNKNSKKTSFIYLLFMF
jgi:hypothetical protein